MLTQVTRPAKTPASWSVAERTRLLELYTRGDILWDTRAEELDKEFGKKHPPNFFTVQSAKYELHLIFRDPNPEHVNTGLPSHPRGKEAAEMWLKHYRKKMVEKQEQAKQMLKIGMRKTLNLVLRYKNGQLPMVELMAMRDQQREQDATRPDADKFEKNLQKFMSQSHAEDLDYVTCLEDLLKVIKGDRLLPPTASPLRSPKVHPVSPQSVKSSNQVSSAVSSPVTQPTTPKTDATISLAEKLGFSPPNRSPTVKSYSPLGTSLHAKSPLACAAQPGVDSTSQLGDQKHRGIDLPVGMGYRTPVSRTSTVDTLESDEDKSLPSKPQKSALVENIVPQKLMEDGNLDSPPSSGLRQRPSSFSPVHTTPSLLSSPVHTKKSETSARKTSVTLRTRTRSDILDDEQEELGGTKQQPSVKKSLKSPARANNMETEEDTSDQDSTEGGPAKEKAAGSLKRRLRTTTTTTNRPVSNAKEMYEPVSMSVGSSRKRGRTETSDVSANDVMDAPPSKNLRRAHGSPPINVSGSQLKQATAELTAQLPTFVVEEKDMSKRRASTRIQVLQKVSASAETVTSAAGIAVKQPMMDEDEITSVFDEDKPKDVKVKKEVVEEEKGISPDTIAFKQEADREEEKVLWEREKLGKGSFSIGTQTNISVRQLRVPIQPITLKNKHTRGRIAPKLPLSMGTQTGQVEFAADDVLYIRPIGSTQPYKPVEKVFNLEEQKGSSARKSKSKPATTSHEDTIAQIAMENEKMDFIEWHTNSIAENAQKASGNKTAKETFRSRNTKDSSVLSQTSMHHSQSLTADEQGQQKIKVVISQRRHSPFKKDKRAPTDTKVRSVARPARGAQPMAAVTKTILIALWKEIIALRDAPIFTQAVSEEDVPGYHLAVKKPMDLSTIRRKVDSGSITTIADFREHIILMFTNAIMFNSTEHDVNHIAKQMLRFCMKLIRDAQYAAGEFGDVSPPVKTSRRSQAVKAAARAPVSPSLDVERADSVTSEISSNTFTAPPPVAAAKQMSSNSSTARSKSRFGTRPTMFLNEEEERDQAENEVKRETFPRKPSHTAFQRAKLSCSGSSQNSSN